jgi:hypothetical protein
MRSAGWRNAVSNAILALCVLGALGCGPAREGQAATARARGERAARDDLARGLMKQREYPPLPYSLQQMNFIKLLQSECGVVWEVVNAPTIDTSGLREEVEAYNAVMRGEIQRKFGADIFQKLRDKAERRKE